MLISRCLHVVGDDAKPGLKVPHMSPDFGRVINMPNQRGLAADLRARHTDLADGFLGDRMLKLAGMGEVGLEGELAAGFDHALKKS